jgi:hypothetical protein
VSAIDVIGFAGFGCLLASLVYATRVRRARRAWVARKPDLYAEWASVPRRARVQIRRALRRGVPPPADYAPLVLRLLQEIDGLWREIPASNRRAARKTWLILALGIAIGAVLIALARPDGQAIGLIIEGYMVTLSLFALRSVSVRSRAASRRARALAVTSAVANKGTIG